MIMEGCWLNRCARWALPLRKKMKKSSKSQQIFAIASCGKEKAQRNAAHVASTRVFVRRRLWFSRCLTFFVEHLLFRISLRTAAPLIFLWVSALTSGAQSDFVKLDRLEAHPTRILAKYKDGALTAS